MKPKPIQSKLFASQVDWLGYKLPLLIQPNPLNTRRYDLNKIIIEFKLIGTNFLAINTTCIHKCLIDTLWKKAFLNGGSLDK